MKKYEVHPHLAHQGVTVEQQREALGKGFRWCGLKCKAFVSGDLFTLGTKRVRGCDPCTRQIMENMRTRGYATLEKKRQWNIERNQRRRANPEAWRKEHLKRVFGVTPQWYEDKLQEQGGHCALCPATVGYKDAKNLMIDHDHSHCSSKKGCPMCVRGLLCSRCNFMVGLAENRWDDLLAARRYLREYERKDSALRQYPGAHALPNDANESIWHHPRQG